MRILQVIHNFLPHHVGGTELYCYHLSRELGTRHDVRVLFTEADRRSPQYDVETRHVGGLRCYRVTHNHLYPSFEAAYADPGMDAVFSRILDQWQPHVVHLHHLLFHSVNYIAIARMRRIPVVFTLHDYWLSCPNFGQRMRASREICNDIPVDDCARCIARYTRPAYLASRLASSFDGLRQWPQGVRPDHPGRHDAEAQPSRALPVGDAHPALPAAWSNAVPGTMRFLVKPAARRALRFTVSLEGRDAAETRFEVRLAGRELWSQVIPAGHDRRAGHREELLLPECNGSEIELEFACTSPASGRPETTAIWSGVELTLPPSLESARSDGLRSVYRALDRVIDAWTHDQRVRAVELRLDRIRDAMRFVDLFVAPSPFLARRMMEFGLPTSRILQSGHGIPVQRRAPRRRGAVSPLRFGYVGVVAPHKGVDILVRAFRRLVEALPADAVSLSIHGPTEWFPRYAAQLAREAGGLPVTFAGEFANDVAAEIYGRLDALVVPSIWWENAPLTVLEARLHRVAVVAADIGALPELIEDGRSGLLFRPGDPEHLAAQLRRLVDDRTLLEALTAGMPSPKSIAADGLMFEREYARLYEQAQFDPAAAEAGDVA